MLKVLSACAMVTSAAVCVPLTASAQSSFYFGGTGAAYAVQEAPLTNGLQPAPDPLSVPGSAIAGYRLSEGPVMLGTELETSLGAAYGSAVCPADAGGCGTAVSRIGSLRAVLGLAGEAGQLVYAHAGLAVADVVVASGAIAPASGALSGWTAGIGFQHRPAATRWFISGDVSYYRFDFRSVPMGQNGMATIQPEFLSARFGLGLSF